MLVDAKIQQGLLQGLIYALGVVVVLGLMLLSGLPILLELILAGLFLLLNYWWYRAFIATQRLTEIWQQDARLWCWRRLGSSQCHSGTLQQARYLGVVIVLNLQCQNSSVSMLIWRDEVSKDEWRKLAVLTRLKQSLPRLF